MLRRLARNTVIAIAAVVAAVLVARALVSRLRPSPEQTPTWPPLTPLPERDEPDKPESVAPAEVSETETPEPVAKNGSAWVEPVDGACPTSHPIKAKLSSGIFHSPGGLNYDRTKPDRCYVDGAAAEADGLRPSKR